MCKSAAEAGGPRRCAGDVRAKLASCIAAVDALQLKQAVLFRAACEAAVDTGRDRQRALARSRQVDGRRDELREEIYEYGGSAGALADYRDAYRDVLVVQS